MHIFLTGGAGYIGSVTTECLLNEGHTVTVFDNLEQGHRDAVDPRARLVVGDLRDRDTVHTAVREAKPDAIMHFAAYALVGESMGDPMKYFRNNVTGGMDTIASAGLMLFIYFMIYWITRDI
jgi:UDP-glucose 4-epimerase